MVLSTSTGDFDKALIESVDEAIKSLFSQQVVEALHANLKDKRSINQDDIPTHLQTLCVVLAKYFGLGARTVERTIAHRLYSKLGLEFQRIEGYHLTDYAEKAKDKLKPAAA